MPMLNKAEAVEEISKRRAIFLELKTKADHDEERIFYSGKYDAMTEALGIVDKIVRL